MATKTKWPSRVFAIFFALLFFIPIVASAGYVIYEQTRPKAATTSPTVNGATPTVNNKLAGTKLANFTPITTPVTALQTIDTVPGTGATVKAGDTVTVDYTGAVAATGVIFQSSLDSGQPATFGLSQVIQGWTNGIPGMKVNGTRRLIIPAAEAYGANPPSGSGIPANADLVFDVTLHSIGQ